MAGESHSVIKDEIEKLLGYALEKDSKPLEYLSIDELMAYTDLRKKIDNCINDAILYKGRVLYAEKLAKAKEQKNSQLQISKEDYAQMVLSNFFRQNNKPFVFDENNMSQFNALLLYFMNDQEFEKLAPNFSLSKGLHLVGGYGCGKTSLMRAFQSNPKQLFETVYVPDIVDDFKRVKAEKKFEVMGQYTDYANIPYRAGNFFNHKKTGVCFDDPGKENITNEYGESWNLFREILLRRYNDKKSFEGLTHMISNGDKEQMMTKYGGDLVDRMNEMFNVIVFPEQKSRRK